MAFLPVALFLLVILGPASPRADAQVVRGTTIGIGGEPAPGVVMLLVDSAGTVVRRTFSGERGSFTIVAPGPGNYALHTLRLGFRPAQLPLPALGAGRDTVLRVALDPVPLALARVVVRARRSCGGTADEGRAAELWNVVRTALEAQALTVAAGGYVMRTTTTDRWLDARGHPAAQPGARRFREGPAVQPFASLGADSLARIGYVADERGAVDWRAVAQRRTGGEIVYRGPDAGVLLSDRFARDHCFEVVASGDSAQQEIGLAFHPARLASTVDVRGTLWVDRRSSELRRITFTYVGLPAAIGDDVGGTVTYLALPGGGWILRGWEIRMPLLGRETVSVPDGRLGRTRMEWRLTRTGTQVATGDVVDVRRAGQVVWTARDRHVAFTVALPPANDGVPPRVRVGMLDPASPIPGGGEAGAAASRLLSPDARGRYQVDSLLPSTGIRVLLWNLVADSLAIAPDTLMLALAGPADSSVAALRPSGVREVVRRLCGRDARDASSRAILGVVRRGGGNGRAAGGVVVQGTFIGGAREVVPGRLVARSERRTVRTDAAGRFLMCDVAAEKPVALFARDGGVQGDPATVRVAGQAAYASVGLVLP